MLEKAQNDYVIRLGLLFAHRFCMRAQQYVKTNAKCDILTYGSVHFHKDSHGNVISMTYRNTKDKNHPWGEDPMDRTIYCTCNSPWTCLPCYACGIIEFNLKYTDKDLNDPIIAYSGGVVTFNEWYNIVRSLIAEIDCDPDDYGTHSLRAGGTSERDIMGESPLELQHFGWWKTLESVFTYIRLSNPDMTRFVNNFDHYVKSRRKEYKLSQATIDAQQASWLKLMCKTKRHKK